MSDSHLLSKTVIQNVSVDLSNTNLDNLTSTGESHFQTPLVSGDNIKTINSNSLLGSGDLVITSVPVGTVLVFAGTTAPTGYLLCDGSAVSRTTYSVLFSVIGTTYGVGDGSSTFNLPNCNDTKILTNNKISGVNCKGTGITIGVTNGTSLAGLAAYNNASFFPQTSCYNKSISTSPSGWNTPISGNFGLTTDSAKSGIKTEDITLSTVSFKSFIKY